MMTAWNRNACVSLPRVDYRSEWCCVKAANEEREDVCTESICDNYLIREKRFKSKVGHEGGFKNLIKNLAYKPTNGARGLKPLASLRTIIR
jgi:hypothetical protein